ncbi:FeoB-associated Cys-rich membrane protein [Lysinibacillus sp. NPDC092081]|uniref:FeoB-associated Cys-rich membrane protein n=1 Tax=Lysinibacillus sp. NPDC092081 TaxID=3364131 RepID=UPI0037F414E8
MMIQTIFNLGDIITTVLLVIFLALFFVMINMIKKMKSTAPLPPQETLQQKVDDLTTRVKMLEHQVKDLSERR